MNSVCWRRSVGSKLCAKKLRELCALCEKIIYPLWEKNISSVREKSPQRISSVLSHMEGAFYFSQRTQKNRRYRAHRERFALPRPQPFTPPCPAVQAYKALPRSPLPLPATSLLCREKSLHITKLTTSRQVNIIIFNQAYNLQEIS